MQLNRIQKQRQARLMTDQLHADRAERVHFIASETDFFPKDSRARRTGARAAVVQTAIFLEQAVELAQCEIAVPDYGRELTTPYRAVAV